MSFTSLGYLAFLVLAAVLSYALSPKIRNALLLVCSLTFLGLYGVQFLPFLAFSILITYSSALLLEKLAEHRKLILVLCLALNLGMLFVFKYLGFFTSLASYFGAQPPEISLILPVGVSFYVFQTTGYLMDVYRGKIAAEHNIIDYALFSSFFPGLVSGPIQRADKMLPQYKVKNAFSYDNIKYGALQFTWGAFKKMVLADRLAVLVDTVYAAPETFSGFQVLVAVVSYSLLIYCDFSAYSDMAIGSARAMGFKLPTNFRNPYFAVSMQDFWRRWHISLSEWFRDYLYFPLGGNRKGKWRGYMNIIIVFTLSGLWHGAALTFVIWGLLHGVLQVVGKILKPYRDKIRTALHIPDSSTALRVFRILLTFAFVSAAWVFFRADSVSDALTILERAFTQFWVYGSVSTLGLDKKELAALLICLAAVLFVSIARENHWRLPEKINEGYVPRVAVYVLLLVAIMVLGSYGEGFNAMDFVYFKF